MKKIANTNSEIIILIIFFFCLPTGIFGQSEILETEYNFIAEYQDQYYEIDPGNKIFNSKQTINLKNVSGKELNTIFFIIHPYVDILNISLEDTLENILQIKEWRYNGTERIYGKYDFPVILIETANKIDPNQKLVFCINYEMKKEEIKEKPVKMSEFTVSPVATYAISPLIGGTPFFRNDASPYTITLKYPIGNHTCVPGKLISSVTSGNYIIDTYKHERSNVPVFSCAPYQIIKKENERIKVEYYLYPTEKYTDEMPEEMFKVIDLYFKTFGDNGTSTYKFATVGELNSTRMNGENKGSTIYFPDYVTKNYYSGPEGKFDYIEFLSHEVFHNWNLFYVYWSGNYRNWFIEGGANFTCSWATDVLIGSEAGNYIRKKFIKRFIEEEGYTSLKALDSVQRTGNPEKALMYTYGALVWEQLRLKIGDNAFFKGFKDFYKNNEFSKVSYQDLILSFENYSDIDIESYLKPWITKNAKIELTLTDIITKESEGEFETKVEITVKANGDYEIISAIGFKTELTGEMNKIPIHIQNSESLVFTFKSKKKPIFIEIDPEYRVPRINLDNTTWKYNDKQMLKIVE